MFFLCWYLLLESKLIIEFIPTANYIVLFLVNYTKFSNITLMLVPLTILIYTVYIGEPKYVICAINSMHFRTTYSLIIILNKI
jgi:hypothetical protein